MSPVRILVVDDHPAVRHGLALLLAPEGIEVCAQAANHCEALVCAEEHHPDLAIVDLSLESEDGTALVVALRRRAIPVLVYSMHQDARHVRGALDAGALGYVTKREFDGALIDAIREVAGGRPFVSPIAAAGLTESAADDDMTMLSTQEREVYRLMGRGEGTAEIASELDISAHTVESYYARIRDKLGLNNMHRLRRHAIDHYQMRA